MDVLTLTTNAEAPFMVQQQAALQKRGVSFGTLSVQGEIGNGSSRSPADYLRFFPQVRREAREGYDLIHAHYGLTAPMALAQRSLPVVLSLWGSDVHGPVEPVSRACVPFCSAVVVMSIEMRRAIGTGEVIPDGVDLDLFETEDQEVARERVGWDGEGYDVLFPYHPGREIKNYPRAKRIAGVADALMGVPVRLRTVSGVSHDRVPDYMNAADALLLTSRSEGSPNSVKEAMACNLPVVATDVGDVSRRLRGVDPSTVARTDEGLIDGLIDVLERGERSNGRGAARKVSLEATADAMLSVYEQVYETDAAGDGERFIDPAVRSDAR